MGGAHARGRVLRGLPELRARFRQAVQDVLGFPYVVPAHQGRGAESLFFGAIIDPGEIVPSNAHFDTTRAHIEVRKGVALDLPGQKRSTRISTSRSRATWTPDGSPSSSTGRRESACRSSWSRSRTNTGGGQPVSLANLREVARLAHGHDKKHVLDIARFAENAWFVREREQGLADTPLPDIVHAMLAEADAVLMSAKKDAIANIGGFVAIREDEEFFRRLQARGIVFEGMPSCVPSAATPST